MDRKAFFRLLAGLPLLSIPHRLLAWRRSGSLCKTERDAEGPFYKSNAPARDVIETEGVPLHVEGVVLNSDDCAEPVPFAELDVWHCDNQGKYDMKGYKGRATIKADAGGKYHFVTILPPPYGNRPRHIHFKIRASGKRELTTQLYFKGDPNIQNDFARNAGKERVISLREEGGIRKGAFDIYL